MRETAADLTRLQALLDRSYEQAGPHLASIHTPEHRPTATRIADLLQGMCLLTVATVTSDGRPLARPVDGIFHHGEFWFGSSPESLLMRHLRARPAVSAVHTRGEELAITVHGRAVPVDRSSRAHAGFRESCLEIYGREWDEWGDSAVYARLEAERMLAFWLPGEPT